MENSKSLTVIINSNFSVFRLYSLRINIPMSSKFKLLQSISGWPEKTSQRFELIARPPASDHLICKIFEIILEFIKVDIHCPELSVNFSRF